MSRGTRRSVLAAALLSVMLLSGCGAASKAGQYEDGVYEGQALGYNAPITVSISVENDRITALSVLSHADDEAYWDRAQSVIDAMLDSGNTQVDAVSGATYSSKGIIEAADKALQKALKNGAS